MTTVALPPLRAWLVSHEDELGTAQQTVIFARTSGDALLHLRPHRVRVVLELPERMLYETALDEEDPDYRPGPIHPLEEEDR